MKTIKVPTYKDLYSPLEYFTIEVDDEIYEKLKDYITPLFIVKDKKGKVIRGEK